ncbi:MAG TPA: TIGR04282 family arsenosugar biosynthesis glycosyltransferase [Stellaceae bacterium]
MAKASLAGAVKTRLVPPLTYDEAARLNTACLADVAANVAAAAKEVPICGFVAYDPIGEERFFQELLPEGFALLAPKEPSLGRSLHHAAKALFAAGYGSVCLVNADSPTLPTAVLVAAVRRLQEPGDRVVLGPAADGGYYLIGLKRFHPHLFEAIDWSTERVCRQTMERAAAIGVPVELLARWYDVDDAPSLALLGAEIGPGPAAHIYPGGFAAPRTAALLARLALANGNLRRLFGMS